ncbi:hypothetical protein ACOSQ3_017855 [Xanthoceras sorbifolium]
MYQLDSLGPLPASPHYPGFLCLLLKVLPELKDMMIPEQMGIRVGVPLNSFSVDGSFTESYFCAEGF